MTYQEATAISSYVEGAIKCTYVRFYYDYGGNGNREEIEHLFSIQKHVIDKQLHLDEETGKQEEIDWGLFTGTTYTNSGYLVDHRYGAELLNMWTHESGGVTQPIVEIRPDIVKEVNWGRKVNRKLVRVRIEASVVRALEDYISKYDFYVDEQRRSSKYKGFQHVSNCMFDFNNLYVKADAIDWQPMDTSLIQKIKSKEQQEKTRKRRTTYMLLALGALMLK